MENAREVAEEKYSQSKVARRILNLLRVCAPDYVSQTEVMVYVYDLKERKFTNRSRDFLVIINAMKLNHTIEEKMIGKEICYKITNNQMEA
jgi:hypothetical protein